ncbi:MAG: hypothetical protein ACLUSP_00240 [Christensenellales bacterium]
MSGDTVPLAITNGSAVVTEVLLAVSNVARYLPLCSPAVKSAVPLSGVSPA